MTTATMSQTINEIPAGGYSDPEPTVEVEAPALEVTAAEFDIARHDAIVTLVSPRTGDHRTFKISTVHHGDLAGKRIVSLLVGPDDYQGFGFIIDGRVMVWRRCRSDYGGPSMFEKYADLLNRASHWAAKGVQYMISLKCRRCSRDLTHPSSLADGLGPICREKMGL